MQPKKPVQVHRCAFTLAGSRDRDRWPHPVVIRFAERHDHVQAVNRTALKDGDEQLRASRFSGGSGPGEKRWREPEGDHRQAARFEKNPSGDHGVYCL